MTTEIKTKILGNLHRTVARNSAVRLWRSSFVLKRRVADNFDPSNLGRAVDAEIDVVPLPARKPPLWLISFCLLVLLPFVASGIYYAFVASDQFVSEARFAVRSVSSDTGSDSVDSGVLTMDSVSQDAYVITSFIHSSEILKRLSKKVDYATIFSGGPVDFLSRLDAQASQEDLLNFWNRQIQTYIDGPSGIVTLKVSAFDPESARNLAALILAESDVLVNQLSQRAKMDIIKRAEEEVDRTEKIYKEALRQLQHHQTSEGILDPTKQATATGNLLSGLIAKKLDLDSRIFVIASSRALDSPAYRQLRQEKAALEIQIEDLRANLTGISGETDQNLSMALVRFSELETDRLMGEKLYEAANRNLSAAQAAALKKAIYLVVFVTPELPQLSTFPNRVSSPFILLLVMFVIWLTGALVWASVEDHRL